MNLRVATSVLSREAKNSRPKLVFKITLTELFCLNKIPAQVFSGDIWNIFRTAFLERTDELPIVYFLQGLSTFDLIMWFNIEM